MKQLSDDQIDRAKEPNQPGRPKITSSENYQNIYSRTHDSFVIIQQISEILFDLEKHSPRFTYARNTVDLFSIDTFEPILKGIFPAKKEKGGPLSDSILFDENKVTMDKIALASYLLKYSSDYILQAFPQHEYEYLHPRIESLVNDLRSMVDAFERTKKLQYRLEEYRQHVNWYEPVDMGQLDGRYNVECLSCRGYNSDETEIDAVLKIEHTPKCKADKKIDKDSKIWRKWYRIIPPKELVITWKQRELLNKLSKN
ncbi:MAG: hypothetical protein IIA83_13085 [Thaumarchaeota archaeon]|nr:hypothetical protein [Nitrososphaerota archaeon]